MLYTVHTLPSLLSRTDELRGKTTRGLCNCPSRKNLIECKCTDPQEECELSATDFLLQLNERGNEET